MSFKNEVNTPSLVIDTFLIIINSKSFLRYSFSSLLTCSSKLSKSTRYLYLIAGTLFTRAPLGDQVYDPTCTLNLVDVSVDSTVDHIAANFLQRYLFVYAIEISNFFTRTCVKK